MTTIIDRHRERFASTPGDTQAFEALEEHLFLAGDWDGVIALYEHRLTASALRANPRDLAQTRFRLAKVLADRVGDGDAAVECLRQVLEDDPRHRPALMELRRIHSGRGNWEVALQIAEVESELPMRPVEQAGLLCAMGAIWLDQLGDTGQALIQFERALEEQPERREALEGAARALELCERPQDAAENWQKLASQLKGPERASANVALARIVARDLQEVDRADQLYTTALGDDPNNPEALRAVSARAAARQQWPLLVDLLERRFERSDDDTEKMELASEIGRVQHNQLAQPDTARAWFCRAAELGSTSADVYEALADYEREHGYEDALLRCLERTLELRGDDAPVSLLLETASLRSDRGDDEAAVLDLQRAASIAPDDTLVIEALSDTLSRLGREDEIVDTLERRASHLTSDPAAHAAAMAELALLHEERLDDADAARVAYERAFAANPAAEGIARSLERLYRKCESFESLRDVLNVAGREGPEEERIGYLCSLGALEIDHFGDRDAAATAYEAALLIDPTHVPAFRGLQGLATKSGDDDAVLDAYRREAAVTDERTRLGFLVTRIAVLLRERDHAGEALEWARRWLDVCPEERAALALCADLQQDTGDAGLCETLERLDPALPREQRAANRRRLGDELTARGRIDDAIGAYRRALDTEPENRGALECLAAHLEATNRPQELASAWRQLAELESGAERVARLDDLARLLAERLGDIGGAVEVLNRIIGEADAPDDVPMRLEALLERGARYEELSRHLAGRVAAETPGENEWQRLNLKRAEVLLVQLGRFGDAAACYREIAQAAPECVEAWAGLERAVRADGDATALADFLGEEAARCEDGDRREQLEFERAALFADELSRGDEAADGFGALVQGATSREVRRSAAARLERMFENAQSWYALRDLWTGRLTDVDDDERASLRESLGQLCRDHLDDISAATDHYRAAAELRPDRGDLWRALGRLYLESAAFAPAVDAFEAELATRPDGEREIALRSRAAALSAGELDDTERARGHYLRLLDIDPAHPEANEFLIRDAARSHDHETVVQLLEARLGNLDAEERDSDGHWAAQRTSLRVRISGLRSAALDDIDGAIAVLEPALSEIGPRPIVTEPLADLYRRAGYHEDLVELCRGAAAATEAPSERANWNVRMGDNLRACNRNRDAAEAYRSALTDRPDDREVQAALRELYRRLGEPEPLTRLLEVELSHRAGPDEIAIRLELAQLLRDDEEREQEAATHLRRVLEIEPGHSEALDSALELAAKRVAPAVALELLDDALAVPRPAGSRADLLGRRARLLVDRPGRADEAEADFREAVELDPSRNDDRIALRGLLMARRDYPAALDCMNGEAAAAAGPERQALLQTAAEIAWEHVSPDAALPWLERLRVATPDDPALLERICEVHRGGERPRALLQALDAAILAASDGVAAHRLRLERAEVLEQQIGAPARAAVGLEEALRHSPGDFETLQRLERIYRALGRHRERARVLELLIADASGDAATRFHCEVAAIYETALGNPQRAAEHLLVAASAGHGGSFGAELLRALGRNLLAAGRPVAWARCAEQELRSLDPESAVLSDRRRELRRALATAYEIQLGRPDAALRHLRALLQLKWTETHGAGGDELDAIEASALRLLRAENNWVELEACLATHLARRPDSAARWLELARLREERLSSPAGAAEAYRAVLSLAPEDVAAIRGLRRCAERQSRWQDVADALQLELSVSADAPAHERSALLRVLGDVNWHRLKSTTRASRCYASALEASPKDFASLRALERLLEAMEDWRGALDLYESEVDMLGEDEPERRQTASLRAGEIARDHTHEVERALRAYVYAAGIAALPAPRRAERAELHLANGDAAAFAAEFAAWCDDPESGAGPGDQLRVAASLEKQDRDGEALEWVERALSRDPENTDAWRRAARLRERAGDLDGAATALERAAAGLADSAAADCLLVAAGLREKTDAESAEALLRDGARRDPAHAGVAAALARVCHSLDDHAEAATMAERALQLDAAGGDLDVSARFDTALAGARSARIRGQDESAARFYARALDARPDHADALAEYGETLAGLGDLAGARSVIEKRLAMDDEDDARALHLAMLGTALVAAGEDDLAQQRLEEAIADDERLDRAHEELVALHERAERIDEGVGCLVRWADSGGEPAERAARLLRAAEWEIRAGARFESAETHLRQVLDANPESQPGWFLLCEMLWQQQKAEEALEVASMALELIDDFDGRGGLELIRGRALEQRGDRREAADAFVVAARECPDCVEAALSAARLLRGLGEWSPAADTLREFANCHSGTDVAGLADVLQQLGRLLAGPLEDLDGAIAAYRRAVDLDPERTDTRAALAEFLSHRPGDQAEALIQHQSLLESNPAHASSLRVLMRIARERGNTGSIATGLEILRALGIASPHEWEETVPPGAARFAGERRLADPLWEKLRELAVAAADEIAAALESSDFAAPLPSADSAVDFRAAAMAAEGQLTAAALLPLPDAVLAEVMTLVATLALDPDAVSGDGRLVNALSTSIGRRSARRLRKLLGNVSLDQIRAVDFSSWRTEVRALAAAVALETTGGELRTAVLAAGSWDGPEAEPEVGPHQDLTAHVQAHPGAATLIRRAVRSWIQGL